MQQAKNVLCQLQENPQLRQYVDFTLPIPQPYQGTQEIKLIVLGQDPTVKNAPSRKNIKTVLNLDRNGSVYAYLIQVCNELGIRLDENVYATNLYKNFFIHPPTQITEIDIFSTFIGYWLPLLQEELKPFADVPIITLGEPILAPLVSGASVKVRDYWGYTTHWKLSKSKPFGYIKPEQNFLNHLIFPFPHQPSLRKQFYKTYLSKYTAFARAIAFS